MTTDYFDIRSDDWFVRFQIRRGGEDPIHCFILDNDDLPKMIEVLTRIQTTIQAARDTEEVLKEVEPTPMNNFKRDYECADLLDEPTKECRVLKARDEYYNAIQS